MLPGCGAIWRCFMVTLRRPISGSIITSSGLTASRRGWNWSVELSRPRLSLDGVAAPRDALETAVAGERDAKEGKYVLEQTPTRRLGNDEDLKGTAVLLASEATRHITGQAIAVDGDASLL